MRKLSIGALAFGVAIVAGTAVLAQAQPTSGVMQLGNQGTGTGFDPPTNQSFHGADKMVPRTVVILEGGTVTFPLGNAVHGVAVYAAGTEPSDIDLGFVQMLAGCPPVPYLTDADGRLASFAPICNQGDPAPSYTFDEPGRYLVICTFAPHLEFADMWGWVIVQPENPRGRP